MLMKETDTVMSERGRHAPPLQYRELRLPLVAVQLAKPSKVRTLFHVSIFQCHQGASKRYPRID